ncbi:hypothetical protein OEZ85_010856 [Tetradesmus obliquus]|uniref:Uncharacterized protein n=1 Tax=Tetradesmus obliquus TaxID=3088 RepID=A0ABY8TNI9_TETOB|nr:hypothetical protein OEZ85_010856 [Tetradesmus obliquus]
MCYLRKHNLPQMIAILQHCKNEGDAVQFLQAGLQQPGFLEALAVLEQYNHLPVSSAEHATGCVHTTLAYMLIIAKRSGILGADQDDASNFNKLLTLLWMTERLQSSSRGPRRLVLGNYLFHSNKLGSELGDAAVPDMAAEDMAAAAAAPAIEPRKFGQGVLTELGAELGGAEALDMAAAAAPAIEPHRCGQGVPPELGPELGGAAAPELPVQGSDASKQQQQAAKKRGWLMCAAGCVAVPLLLGVLCRKMRG